MTLEDSIHSQRLRVLRDAERLGNVSDACRRHGVSRTVFYRWRQRLEQYGPDGVHPKRRQARRGRPPAVSVQTERRVIAFALAWPTCGPQWYSDQLAREGLTIAPVTVWRLLRRQRLGTRRARLAVLEQYSAGTTGLLTERTAKPARHVAATRPGDLLCLDTFYVGKLKGVGKVWQITGCVVARRLPSPPGHRGGHGGRGARVPAGGRVSRLPTGRLAAAARPDRQRQGVQGGLCRRL
jgi:transposase